MKRLEQVFELFDKSARGKKCKGMQGLIEEGEEIIEGLREVYYTPIGEDWRVPAMRLLWAATAKYPWNEGFERLEGMLFGYEEWQIDWWICDARERGRSWADPNVGEEHSHAIRCS